MGRFRCAQVAGEYARDYRMIGGTLDVRMATQCINTSAGSSDVAEQQLENGSGTNNLTANGVHRPTNRVHDSADLVGGSGRTDNVRDLEEVRFRATRDSGYRLRRISTKVLLQKLKDAARVLQRRVAFRVSVSISFVVPGIPVVLIGSFVKSREESIFKRKLFGDDEGGVGVDPYVVVMEKIVF